MGNTFLHCFPAKGLHKIFLCLFCRVGLIGWLCCLLIGFGLPFECLYLIRTVVHCLNHMQVHIMFGISFSVCIYGTSLKSIFFWEIRHLFNANFLLGNQDIRDMHLWWLCPIFGSCCGTWYLLSYNSFWINETHTYY